MTVSTSPCWKKPPEPAWLRATSARLLKLLLLCLCLCAVPAALAAGKGLDFRYFEIQPVDQAYVVNASVELQANPRLQEMVESGLVLPFQAEFTLSRGRWYWLDESIVQRNMNFRLFYHALTRQYRLSIGSIHRNFSSFDEALRAMLTIRNWSVLEHGGLVEGESYKAALRFRLDMSQLPKPFQVVALGNRELDLNTGWVVWPVIAPVGESK